MAVLVVVYGQAIALILSLSALGAERVLIALRYPRRGVWLLASFSGPEVRIRACMRGRWMTYGSTGNSAVETHSCPCLRSNSNGEWQSWRVVD
jgi:hypothetical protein